MDQTAQIQIQYVNQRNGNKPPSIKDSQGNYFTITDGSVGMFQQGEVGTAVYYVNRSNFNVMKSWNGVVLPKGQAQQAQQPLHPNAVVNSPQTQQPNMPARSDDQSENIFVTGVVGRSMQSGKYDIGDIDRITKEAVRSWRNRNMSEPIPTQHFEGGMPDNIPPANGPEDYGQNLTAAG